MPFTAAPLEVALSILFLHFSFWSVYEIGYYENDLVASKFEVDANVPVGFKDFENGYSASIAWAWAIALGAAGVAFAWLSGISHLQVFGGGSGGAGVFAGLLAIWVALLVAMRLVFRLYNHIDKMTRVFVYLPLQIAKYAGPALIFPLSPAGAALVFAQIMRRWLPYIVYRYTRKESQTFPARIVRLLVFASLWLVLLPSEADRAFVIHGAVIFAWLALRGLRQMRDVLDNVAHVASDGWKSQ
ncbi:hypothetical protein [Ostreiculturibacter nitratireducens]|uniref:hypothetical protein n=1 Tax=Ostreiculturibacter nitratireducens TaxID=3075226 RepID=UPI0031B59FB7